jgi:undecaprenyl diphosphate synthase
MASRTSIESSTAERLANGSTSRGPNHVAIIMDGNRRWARARGMPPVFGHQRGAEAVRRTVEGCRDLEISHLTLFAFSSENWRRPASEISELMNLLRFYLRREISELTKNGVRLCFLGEPELMAPDIAQMMAEADARTRANSALTLTIAMI